MVKINRFLYIIRLKKYLLQHPPKQALQEHITSDKHFGEPSSDQHHDTSVTSQPQSTAQTTDKIINKYEHVTDKTPNNYI